MCTLSLYRSVLVTIMLCALLLWLQMTCINLIFSGSGGGVGNLTCGYVGFLGQ